jgi:plasmid stabilization system protein ParE
MDQTYRVIVALEVWKQLREIVEWTEENHSPERAGKVKNVILSAIDSLAAMPTRHPIVRSVSTKGIIYRRILAERYRIVFTIFEQTATVKVVDIDHERRNPKLLIDKLNK